MLAFLITMFGGIGEREGEGAAKFFPYLLSLACFRSLVIGPFGREGVSRSKWVRCVD